MLSRTPALLFACVIATVFVACKTSPVGAPPNASKANVTIALDNEYATLDSAVTIEWDGDTLGVLTPSHPFITDSVATGAHALIASGLFITQRSVTINGDTTIRLSHDTNYCNAIVNGYPWHAPWLLAMKLKDSMYINSAELLVTMDRTITAPGRYTIGAGHVDAAFGFSDRSVATGGTFVISTLTNDRIAGTFEFTASGYRREDTIRKGVYSIALY